MSLDLNGSPAGTNYVISYLDDSSAIGIVASGVVVGSGSSSVNTDGVNAIQIGGNWASGDYLQIGTLPSGLVLSGPGIAAGATSWTGQATGPVFIQRASQSTTPDAQWGAALQCVKFYNSTPQPGPQGLTAASRTINIDTLNASGALISHATSTINVNNAPWVPAQVGNATEAGGVNNTTAGAPATGNVLQGQVIDDPMDASTDVVSAVSFGGAAGTVGSALQGAFGKLTLNSDGSYTYAIDETNASVQALATSAQILTEVFNFTVRDTAGATGSSQLSIAIHGANDAATISGTSAGTVTGNSNVVAGNLTAGGALSISDPDAGQSSFVAQSSVAGTYGTFTLAANGAWTYAASNSQSAIQGLSTGQTLTDSFTARSLDGTSSKVVAVTIQGPYRAPVAAADTATAVEAGGVNNASAGANPVGNVLANDTVDPGDSKTVAAVMFGATAGAVGSALTGAYGSLTLNADGSYAYTVNNSNASVEALRAGTNTLADTFSYTLKNSAGASSTATLTITIQGTNDAPVANLDRFDVVASGTANGGTVTTGVSGNLLANDADVDAGDTKQMSWWSGSNSPYGTAGSVTAGGFTFTVNSSNAAVQALRTYNDTLTASYLAVMAAMGGPVALVPLVTIPLMIGTSLALQGPLDRAVQASMQASVQKQSMTIEVLTGIEALKLAAAEGIFQGAWERSVRQISKAGMRSKLISSFGSSMIGFYQSIAGVALVIVGVYQVSEQKLTLGGLIACSILMSRALAPMSQVAMFLARWAQTKIALRSVTRLLERAVERPEGKTFVLRDRIEGSVEFRAVTFSYPGAPVPALRNVSFSIAAGERVAIIGRSGSGKSTIAKLTTALYDAAEGSVLVGGVDTRQLDPHQLRRAIGAVAQDPFLFNGSVRVNIAYGSDAVDDHRVMDAAKEAGVDEFVRAHPMGYDLPVGERGALVSGGQRQAIVLARALVGDPSVLLLDEPSSSLDLAGEQALRARLQTLRTGETLILITHRLQLLDIVDRVIVMHDGKVAMDGPRAAVMERLARPAKEAP
ncbi:VCBS domain-containing protein [Caenimonas aquaedulcis]|uniref:Cyclolysin secretion/processing ATP-binding protein CyaB n=1 Tax=Caenimonas aquaedulcis TaxID=2793270 RepID=A0A931H7D6_9BURK|nr:VCBS domain-containing protein [Caenimonas aquaedulcis]MBG9390040.1 VCBS domain-containing protein [Caenimonas aquaedulcis]